MGSHRPPHALDWAGRGHALGAHSDAGVEHRSVHPPAGQTVALPVAPDRLQPVQEAATAHGATVAAWVRQARRPIPPEDVPHGSHVERCPS